MEFETHELILNEIIDIFIIIIFPYRLRDMCYYYVGEAGEIDMFNTNKEGPEKLMEFLCYGKGVYGQCSKLKPPIKTEL